MVNDPEDYRFTSLQELLFPCVTPYINVEKVLADFGGEAAFKAEWQRVRRKKGLNGQWEDIVY
ncbi:hypothetical protein [Lewinella sp. IMCC34183]|uniref:hypothetical protein n=1 Tax=Lewinella sp. IMCC34183 TaxID=2248762 RepID=UPI0013003EE4|nr:hypothetical protein [Lewinella sp. IMCC34183]